MPRTKSASPNASRLDKDNIARCGDPLTKWVTRAIYLLITLATFSWLDTIKVGNLFSFDLLYKVANPVLNSKDRWYVFDPVYLHELQLSALSASPNDTPGMISHILSNLTATYPNTRAYVCHTREHHRVSHHLWHAARYGGPYGPSSRR